MKNFLKNEEADRDEETTRTFGDSAVFDLNIRRMYEDINAKRTAERQLYEIKQIGSTSKYVAAFQFIASEADWDDTALTAQFYRGLKNTIKNEIARTDRSTTLQKMIRKAIILNNRQYERRLKKQERNSFTSAIRVKDRARKPYYRPQLMKINATQRYEKPREERFVKQLERKLNDFRQKSKECYTCEKLEHFLRKCTQNRYKDKSKSYNKQGKSFAAVERTERDKHNNLSWTACYEDNCVTHVSDKEGSEWYSKPSRKNRLFATTHRQSEAHDENNDEKSYIMIEKSIIPDSEDSDQDSTIDAINQVIHESNRLEGIIAEFIKTAENVLNDKEENLDIEKGIKEIINKVSFMSMYNEMYDLFMQKEEDFPQRM